jgi:hypothetical protein
MMGIEMVPETTVIFNQLTRLMVREDFITISRSESTFFTFVMNAPKMVRIPVHQAMAYCSFTHSY